MSGAVDVGRPGPTPDSAGAVLHPGSFAPGATARCMADRPAGRGPAAACQACRTGSAHGRYAGGWPAGRPAPAGPPGRAPDGSGHAAPRTLPGTAAELTDDPPGAVRDCQRPARRRRFSWFGRSHDCGGREGGIAGLVVTCHRRKERAQHGQGMAAGRVGGVQVLQHGRESFPCPSGGHCPGPLPPYRNSRNPGSLGAFQRQRNSAARTCSGPCTGPAPAAIRARSAPAAPLRLGSVMTRTLHSSPGRRVRRDERRWVCVYLVLEFQSRPDPGMSLRIPVYVALQYLDLQGGQSLHQTASVPHRSSAARRQAARPASLRPFSQADRAAVVSACRFEQAKPLLPRQDGAAGPELWPHRHGLPRWAGRSLRIVTRQEQR